MLTLPQQYTSTGAFCCFAIDGGEEAPSPLPAEEELAEEMGYPGRRKAFLWGRAAARTALSRFEPELRRCFIGRGERGAPVWPEGYCGSISHSKIYVCAWVDEKASSRGLGVDIEELPQELSAGLVKKICRPEEVPWVKERKAEWQQRLVTLFSAKEAVYKALFPVYGEFFGFQAATLTPSGEGAFTGELHLEKKERLGELGTFRVYFHYLENQVVSAVQFTSSFGGQK